MKQSLDTSTLELPSIPRPRGRPVTGCAMTAAERKRKQRQASGLVPVTIELPSDLVDQLNEFLRFKDTTKNALFSKLIRTQLLRKR